MKFCSCCDLTVLPCTASVLLNYTLPNISRVPRAFEQMNEGSFTFLHRTDALQITKKLLLKQFNGKSIPSNERVSST